MKFTVEGRTNTHVYTWNTWKKKFNPKIMQVQDGTLGYVSKIKATMLHGGFKHTELELAMGTDASVINGGKKPLEILKTNFPELIGTATYIVYYVWKHSRGYCKYLEIFYI